ncbi:hypothetical protein TGCAST_274030 [Toxoplasma gondii CAST]|uniref:Uncharacterized protein n=1 Tax=Toxoplasma gondii CAST TaxID=943122 RepID=A0A3R8BBL4_TOXGO|nr:hypothetical protein TGCAST_274030 [Toxoplasma gondii CAST]
MLVPCSAAAAKQAGERGAKERLHSEQPTHSEPVSDISWRINLILQYASCLADAGKIVDAFKGSSGVGKGFRAIGGSCSKRNRKKCLVSDANDGSFRVTPPGTRGGNGARKILGASRS